MCIMNTADHVALPFRHVISFPWTGPGRTGSRKAKGIYFCGVAKDTFELEVKLEVGLEGEDTGGKECLPEGALSVAVSRMWNPFVGIMTFVRSFSKFPDQF